MFNQIIAPKKNMQDQFDTLINSICTNVSGGELKQLGALFTQSFLQGLSKIIYENELNNHPSCDIEVESQLCWIDKAPYAQLCDGIPFDRKVELGDAMFIFDKQFIDNNSQKLISERKKAFILQAKVTDKDDKNALVPITGYDPIKKNSTFKELELYKQWLPFNISYASNTNRIEEPKVDVIKYRTTDTYRFAWYGVVADKKNGSHYNWPCRWMVGKSLMGQPCDRTMGELLSGFYQDNNVDGVHVGEYYSGTTDSNAAWGKVVWHVLTRCQQLKMPKVVPQHSILNCRKISHKKSYKNKLHTLGLDKKIINDIASLLIYHPNLPMQLIVYKTICHHLKNKKIKPNDFICRAAIKAISIGATPITVNVKGIKKPRSFPIIRIVVKRYNNE